MEDLVVSQALEDAVALIESQDGLPGKSLSFASVRFRLLSRIPEEIAKLPGLTALDLSGTNITDLSPLAALQELQVLNLSQTRVEDLSPLSKLGALTHLELAGTDVQSLLPLVDLPQLAFVDVSDTAVDDPRPLLPVAERAAEQRDKGAVVFAGIPALAQDPELAEIAAIQKAPERARELASYIYSLSDGWPPPADAEPDPQQMSVDLDGMRDVLDRTEIQIREQKSAADDLSNTLAETQKTLVTVRDDARKEIVSLAEDMKNRYEDLEAQLHADMEAAVNAYTGAQAIKEPVTLWAEKQKEHQAQSTASMKRFFVGLAGTGAVVAGLMTVVAFYPQQVAELLSPVGCSATTPEHCDGFSFKGMAMVAGVLTILTLLLWVTRLQMKVYLAERHLALDARERQAFAQSYVGLLGEGDTTEEAKEQRALVYAALFRPTSDGIIKDEGGIDPSVAAAVSKFLSGR